MAVLLVLSIVGDFHDVHLLLRSDAKIAVKKEGSLEQLPKLPNS